MDSGILLVNKPRGITSNKVVLNLKKRLKIQKIGHTGILDYGAEGLLVVLIGKATRLAEYLQKLDKEYISVGKLGEFRDTYDSSGRLLYRKECFRTIGRVEEAIKSFEGSYNQLPPPYSSKKIKGIRAYKLAKKGISPDLKPVKVNIYNIDILEIPIPFFKIKVSCSSGTYIRSLVKDIGDKLNCYAYMHSLVRTKVGNFSIDQAVDFEYLKNLEREEILKFLIPMEEALFFMPAVFLNDNQIRSFTNGRHIFLNQSDFLNTPVKVFSKSNQFIGVGFIKNGILKPEKVFVR